MLRARDETIQGLLQESEEIKNAAQDAIHSKEAVHGFLNMVVADRDTALVITFFFCSPSVTELHYLRALFNRLSRRCV